MVELELIDQREAQKQRNYGLTKMTYSICKIVFSSVIFSFIISMILNNAGDYKILGIAIVFLLAYEWLRTIRYNAI